MCLLSDKLTQLSVPTSICQWITSFLTDRQTHIQNSHHQHWRPSGLCSLPTALLPLHKWLHFKGPSVKLLKFADDTTVIGLIKDGDESAYRQEVEQLAVWCSLNNLELNILKTVEMIMDFRRNPQHSPPHHHEQRCDCSGVIQIPGNHHLSGPEVGQSHWLYCEKGPAEAVFSRKFNLPQELLKQFYSAIIESVLCSSITVWFGSATKTDTRRLQRTVRTAERIIGDPLPALNLQSEEKG